MKTTPTLEVLFTPAEFTALAGRDLSQTDCVVFDILRATSSIVTALANGATAVIPVADIPEALALRRRRPEVLLAGERQGLRIRADLAGGIDFDLGNSPREFTADRVNGRTLVMSTTNGSCALRACNSAQTVLASSFLNLKATAEHLTRKAAPHLLLVCGGTFDQAALEDVLGAGALADLLVASHPDMADSARIALQIYRQNQHDLAAVTAQSRNGKRLLANPDLRDDVAWCLQRDIYSFAARLDGESVIKEPQ